MGVIFDGAHVELVYERSTKGDIPTLLSGSTIFADLDLRLTLMNNVIQVRKYFTLLAIDNFSQYVRLCTVMLTAVSMDKERS